MKPRRGRRARLALAIEAFGSIFNLLAQRHTKEARRLYDQLDPQSRRKRLGLPRERTEDEIVKLILELIESPEQRERRLAAGQALLDDLGTSWEQLRKDAQARQDARGQESERRIRPTAQARGSGHDDA